MPALEYFTVTQAGTDEAKLIFLWRVKYDGGHDIINFAIQYQRVLDASEGKPDMLMIVMFLNNY